MLAKIISLVVLYIYGVIAMAFGQWGCMLGAGTVLFFCLPKVTENLKILIPVMVSFILIVFGIEFVPMFLANGGF